MSVEVRDLSFAYGKKEILHGVTFTAERGDMLAVLGPNGAGKSTLFRCILGVCTQYSGEVRICHKEIRSVDRRRLAGMVAYVPQNSTPVFNYPVRDIILMGTTGALSPVESPKQAQVQAAREAMEMLDITHLADCGIAEISGGEQQLVLIARAIVQNAKVLVMDEPTSSLDYGNQHKVLRMARALADRNYTILLSTHNPEHAASYATHVLALEGGRVTAYGQASETVTDSFIRKLYRV